VVPGQSQSRKRWCQFYCAVEISFIINSNLILILYY
jgi:hypothetical protein